MKVNQDQLKVMLDSLDPKLDKQKVLESMIADGLQVEGFNDAPKQEEKGFFGRMGDKLGDRVDQISQGFGKFGDYNKKVTEGAPMKDQAKDVISGSAKIASGVFGSVADLGGEIFSEIDKNILGGAVERNVGEIVKEVADSKVGKQVASAYQEYFPKDTPQRDVAEAFGNIISAIPTVKGFSAVASSATKGSIKAGMKATADTVKSGLGFASEVVTNPTGIGAKVSKEVKDLSQAIIKFDPNANLDTKATLNPFLYEKSRISLPDGKGGFILKMTDEATPVEVALYQADTLSKYRNYLEISNKYKINPESVGGMSAVDEVGNKIATYVEVADKLRQKVGKQMGEIESALAKSQVDLTQTNSLQGFIDNYGVNKSKAGFGGKDVITPETKTFISDLQKLQKRKADVSTTLDFVRTWEKKLNNMKDATGNFKDNAYDNVQIQNVVNDIKNQTRNSIAETNPEYRKLVAEYKGHIELQDEADRLLGRTGAMGDKVRAGATAKRAVTSLQDNGTRQMLIKLKDVTGYDGLSDSRVALKAMIDAGDERAMSLLSMVKDVKSFKDQDWAGRAMTILEKFTKPDEAQVVEEFIKKSK